MGRTALRGGAVAIAIGACGFASQGAEAAVPATCPGPDDAAFGAVTTTTGTFDASMENSYVQIPFTVPAGTTGVRIRYCFDQPDIPLPNGLNNNTLDLSVYEPLHAGHTVYGPDELRGSSGSSIRDVTLAPNGFSSEAVYEAAPTGYVSGRTTRAYEPGPIPQGEWVAELGLAAISTTTEGNLDNAVAWRVDVQTTASAAFANDPYSPAAYDSSAVREDPGWYAGDFHVHGEHEPGNALMRETFDYAFAPVAEGGGGAGLRPVGGPQQHRRLRRDREAPERLSGQPRLSRHRGDHVPRPHKLSGIGRAGRLPDRTDPAQGGEWVP